MKKAYLFFTLITIFFAFESSAQKGSISGSVADSTTNEMLFAVTISIDGTTIGVTSDLDGNFSLNNLKDGTYKIKLSMVSYNSKIVSVEIKDGNAVNLGKINISGTATGLQTVEVAAEKITNTAASVISDIKKSDNVVSGISSQQITRSQDRDASEVVKRLPGVSLVANKFIMIRGLGERYNNVQLNGVTAPSSEYDSRAFSFDIIPSGMIEKILIYKSPAPELPSDFSGGVVKVFTKSIPDKNSFSISYSQSLQQDSAKDSYYSLKKGKYSALGYDDGTYGSSFKFPDEIDSKGYTEGKQYFKNDTWKADKRRHPRDHRAGLEWARRFKIGDNFLIGNYTAINYSNTNQHLRIHKRLPRLGGGSVAIYDFNEDEYVHSVRLGVLQNNAFRIGNNHKIEIKNIFSRMANMRFTHREGTDGDDPQTYKIREFFSPSYRSLYTGQVSGTHTLIKGLNFDWTSGYSDLKRDDPDNKNTLVEENMKWDAEQKKFVRIPDAPKLNQIVEGAINSTWDYKRLYSETTEKIVSGNANLEYQINFKSEYFKPKIKIGGFYEDRQKQYIMHAYGLSFTTGNYFVQNVPLDSVLIDRNFDNDIMQINDFKNQWVLEYKAGSVLKAGYLAVNIPATRKLNIYTGLRYEDYYFKFETKDRSQSAAQDYLTLVTDTVISYLPSANISYNFDEVNILRLGYGKTLNRFEFLERYGFGYVDWYDRNYYAGNADLKCASIDNFDLRYERYPNPGETFSIGLFYKYIKDPIEINALTSTGGGILFTPTNGLFAFSNGVELEWRKSFRSWFPETKVVRDFSFFINAAYINSKSRFVTDGEAVEKPMMWQAPYMFNAGLYYINDSTKSMISLVFNINGPRVVVRGTQDFPDIYEMPFAALDLTFSQRLSRRFDLKGGIQNILNPRYQQLQYYSIDFEGFKRTGNEFEISEGVGYKRGRYYSLGITFTF